MIHIHHQFVLLAAASIAAAGIRAEPPGHTELDQDRAIVAAVFERLDCGFAGVIDPGEVDDHFGQIWGPADRDGSRSLSMAEFERLGTGLTSSVGRPLFVRADRDGNDTVTAWELREFLQQAIGNLDADDDYEINRADAGLKPLQQAAAADPASR